ncbi:hypothetical protein BWQ96_09953 [Gracilariopsis chorda]|uniref:R3H domain-containing protein n=1 Tax=Gracilariopsis chorda TaxID=448386 RepID=A0A2V3IE61_9FLOR|nr:hypothetical protein BWQ96_09953 [Gracilariopsis chorda]|eukprot:PXF40332.1 hypothetical protein BWQ96_09953 [Gracilariopsis chorda]
MLCPETPCKAQIVAKCPCGRRRETTLCLRSAYGQPQESNSDIRLPCDEECEGEARRRAFAAAVGRDDDPGGHGGDLGPSGREETKFTDFLHRFAETEPDMLSFFESELAQIVLGKTRKIELDDLPQLHRLVLHTLVELYNLESESRRTPKGKKVVVKHRGPGEKPVFPKPLLSESYADLVRQRKHDEELNRTMYMGFPGSAMVHNEMQLQSKAVKLLKTHAGSYRLPRTTTMSTGQLGVVVQFSTSERCSLVKEQFRSRSDVTIEEPSVDADASLVRRGLSRFGVPQAGSSSEKPWSEEVHHDTDSYRNYECELRTASMQDQMRGDVPNSWDD